MSFPARRVRDIQSVVDGEHEIRVIRVKAGPRCALGQTYKIAHGFERNKQRGCDSMTSHSTSKRMRLGGSIQGREIVQHRDVLLRYGDLDSLAVRQGRNT